MAYIKVNHKKLDNVADEIDDYISKLAKNMKNIDTTVNSLGAEWKGEDYSQVKREWNEINAGGSTTDGMKTSLKTYAESLREAAELYKKTQTRAINRANTLCK